jgi:hypothetical protein
MLDFCSLCLQMYITIQYTSGSFWIQLLPPRELLMPSRPQQADVNHMFNSGGKRGGDDGLRIIQFSQAGVDIDENTRAARGCSKDGLIVREGFFEEIRSFLLHHKRRCGGGCADKGGVDFVAIREQGAGEAAALFSCCTGTRKVAIATLCALIFGIIFLLYNFKNRYLKLGTLETVSGTFDSWRLQYRVHS